MNIYTQSYNLWIELTVAVVSVINHMGSLKMPMVDFLQVTTIKFKNKIEKGYIKLYVHLIYSENNIVLRIIKSTDDIECVMNSCVVY